MPTQGESRADGAKLTSQTEQSTQTSHVNSNAGARKTFSTHLIPLQVRGGTSGGSANTNGASTADDTTSAPPRKQQQRSLSLASGKAIENKIAQLSQLQSPQLRELARRLGDRYNIQTPRYAKCDVPHVYAHIPVAPKWEEIQGSKRWAGLLDPIDPVLRAELVRYGEFTQATYDSFDGDLNSKYAGSCKYEEKELFERVGLDNRGYKITDFLYATSDINLPNFFTRSLELDTWSRDSNWIGYVAVCTSPKEIARLGRRDIVVAWRGTIMPYEWIEDVQDYLAPAGLDPREAGGESDSNVMVESGFLSVYTTSKANSRYNEKSAREQVLGAVKKLVVEFKDEGKLSITVVGHSLGSALATLCAYDIAESKINLPQASAPVPNEWDSQKVDSGNSSPSDRIPVTVFSFAGPRVGNKGFKDAIDALGVAVLRVVDVKDVVPKVPGFALQGLLEILEKFIPSLPSYEHVGELLEVDFASSTYFKESINFLDDIANFHNLEGYLHLVDGYHGSGLPFELTTRDYSLANKGAELLKHDYYIPVSWWQEAYKGLVREKDGRWVVPPRPSDLFPTTPSQSSTQKVTERQDFYHCVSTAVENAIKKLGVKDPEGKVSAAARAAAGQKQDASVSSVHPSKVSQEIGQLLVWSVPMLILSLGLLWLGPKSWSARSSN